jgi:hypothetical protein
MIPLAAFEEIIDASGVAARIEAMLPAGVRPRQLRARTLLAGMCLAAADHRPAHLTRVHQALGPLAARTAAKEQAADHDRKPASWPATSSAASPPTTKTATTASPAPPSWARSAARSAPRR